MDNNWNMQIFLPVPKKSRTFAPNMYPYIMTHTRYSILTTLPLLILLCTSCGKPAMPKQYGYYRISLPAHEYKLMDETGYPYEFAMNTAARIVPTHYEQEQYWIDIAYPTLNAAIRCSYKPVRHNLRQLSDDAQLFVFNHAVKATAIPEHAYSNPEAHTYGVLYDLEGNTASPVQFYLTDSTRHFFRGAVYINCVPNQDSLAPVIEFIRRDILNLMETFRWTY